MVDRSPFETTTVLCDGEWGVVRGYMGGLRMLIATLAGEIAALRAEVRGSDPGAEFGTVLSALERSLPEALALIEASGELAAARGFEEAIEFTVAEAREKVVLTRRV